MSSFLLVALNKIYKSRDGLTAVSSNTSIMSELSNISKSSLPSSMPVPTHPRQTSTSSSTMSSSKNNHSASNNTPTINNSNYNANANSGTSGVVHNSNQSHLNNIQKAVASVQKQTHASSSSVSGTQTSNQTLKDRIQSNSSKQLQQLSSRQHQPVGTTASSSSATITNINSNSTTQAASTTSGSEFQRRNTVHYETSRLVKKPGQNLHNTTHLTTPQSNNNHNNSTNSSIPTINHNRNTNDPKSSLLLINTNNMLITCSSTSSPSASSTSSSARNKTELKLNKEIERLEALCESRTKELSLLKLKLKQVTLLLSIVLIKV